MIDEIYRELPEPFTRKQLIDAIIAKYEKMRTINTDSLGTDIAGCCVNLKSHSSLPDLPLILVSLGRGKYRCYNPGTDKKLNLYVKQNVERPKIAKGTGATNQIKPTRPSKTLFYDFNGAERVLRQKGFLDEIYQIIENIKRINHSHIQELFTQWGWDIEYQIHPDVTWAWDAYKDRIPVSIELSLIDAVHRDFLRLILWDHGGRVDAMVYITSTFKEPKFKNVKRDLEILKPILKVPILLIGLSPM